jgi:GT2 family glycosyltransferase/glycosyltransferase involved in cell wall biosynthesis
MKQDVVCIAGAHRSGTSMLTRLLHQCGLDLGPEGDLMPAASDNPDGFWENLRFVQLNDEILNTVGAAWDLPPWQEETFNRAGLQPMRAKAQLLIERFQGTPVWGWKDPRNCLTLLFWRSLLPGLKTIVMVRNPLEVAYSMHKRNGTSYALGLRLWEIYNRRLLAETRPEERVIVHYQAFFEEPETELKKVATFAGLEGKETAAALVAVNRRHTAFTIEQMIDAGVSGEIVALYRSLIDGTAQHGLGRKKTKRTSAVEGDQLAGTESKLDASIPNSEDVRRELATRRGDAVRHLEETARFQKTIDGLREELTAKNLRATAEINRRDGRIEELQKAYAHLDRILQGEQAQRNQLLAELEKTRREFSDQDQRAQAQLNRDAQELESARQQSARAAEELQKVRERFAQSNQLLQKTSVRLADFETRNASLTERLRKQLLEMKRLLRLLDQITEAAGLLRRSRRWKLANPFAALRAAFTGKALEGFGHIDKNVEKYRSWRSAHPEAESLGEEIQELRPREIPSPPATVESASASLAQPDTTARPPLPTAPIEFPTHEQVEVSIVIPVYNQVDFTHACLAAVRQNSGDIPYEIIVVDDASTDATPNIIGKIPGITYLRTAINAGFIASCNRGASAARGRYLVFLNNDTTVTSGWLTALHETFTLEPEAGLVGSKLIYPDGRLQEAGGIIWRDGSGWNRGKLQDPAKPEYNYLKEVDYCSAASVMISKTLFDRLRGFDPRYAPAYYEDTDLAFKVKQSGRKVLYQPLSVVVHYEGVTSGIDTSSGVKKYQAVNRTTFTTAWANVLADKPENGDLVSYESAKTGKRRVLVIDHHLPMPDRDSGSLRMFQILSILHRLGHHVTFIPDNLADISPYADELRKRGIEVIHYPHTKTIRDYLQREGATFDVVILSRCDFARKHISDVRQHAPQSRVIFDTVDLHFLRQDREADLVGDAELKRQAEEQCDLEYDLIDQADETWVVSPAEQELLRLARPQNAIEVVSNIVDVPGSAVPFSIRRDLLFIGSFQHPPNVDAILYFTREIFPLVRRELPGAKFFIIGDKAPPEVMAQADEEVIVAGFQPDVSSYFNNIKLSVAPLRYGAGVKGKINQSMGFGVPVVATSIAAEGMNLRSGEDILVEDEPARFAVALVELYTSEALWNRLSANSVVRTRELYSTEAARAQLERLLERTDREGKFPAAGCEV